MSESTCPGLGCIAGPVIDGLCLEHYIESLLPQVAAFKPHAYVDPIIRFLGYSDRSGGPDACWLWTSCIHPQQGFGTIFDGTAKPRVQKAHRWAYEFFIGPIPEGREVGHSCHTHECPGGACDHRRCVNPRHLVLTEEPARYAYDCAKCGKRHTKARPIKGSVAFCSMECRSGGRMVTKTCPVCGKDFTVPQSNDERYQTCSAACKNVDTEYVNCERCGKRFAPRDSRKRRRHCSDACRRPPLMMKCVNCGKEFRKSASQVRKRYCSVSCVRQFMGETELEALVRVALERLGVGFVQEYPFRRWSIDFAVPKHKLAIEADGVYWHSITGNRDSRRDARMSAAGWKIVRFGEMEVKAASDLGRLILGRIHEVTGLGAADLAGVAQVGTRRSRPVVRQGGGRRTIRPAKGQLALWP